MSLTGRIEVVYNLFRNIDRDGNRGMTMNVLVIDVGGTSVKILASGQTEARKCASGVTMTPAEMVKDVKELAGDWKFDAVSIGYPGVVHHGRIIAEPHNLGPGWIGFDFVAAFGCPVKVINDAAMQALGSYKDGILLFIGLGTGLGSAVVYEGTVVPLELARLAYRKGEFEDYVGKRGLDRFGSKRWRWHVETVVAQLTAGFRPDDIVIGGGNSKKLKTLPPGCRLGDNANAFIGGFRMWEDRGRGKVDTAEKS